MGFFSWLFGGGQSSTLEKPPTTSADTPRRTSVVTEPPVTAAPVSGWVMPTYRGRNICDWNDDISRLKRDGDNEQALELAIGCMQAMQEEAQRNPDSAMDYYVKQVVIIQHKLKDYSAEITVIEDWLALGIPATREDYRLDLRKRLAKAKEQRAKQQGEDPSEFTAEWRALVAESKTLTGTSSGPTTGRSTTYGTSYRTQKRKPRWVAPAQVLASPSFVAVDFETANTDHVSACQIAMVRVDNGRVVDRFCTLLAPPPGFDSFEFTYLHGIGPRHIRSAPSWAEIVHQVRDFVGDLPMYAHNASFDADVWHRLDQHFHTDTLPEEFYCSYRTAEKMVPGLENYKLPTVTKALVRGFRLNHHSADSDAEACALIMVALQRMA